MFVRHYKQELTEIITVSKESTCIICAFYVYSSAKHVGAHVLIIELKNYNSDVRLAISSALAS